MSDRDARSHANRSGVLAMVAAMGFFVVNDALVKVVSQSLPAAQLIFIRSAMASLLVLTVVLTTDARSHICEIGRGWVLVRAGLDAVSTLLFLVSLFHLPIATATSVISSAPLLIALLAARTLGERVTAEVWLATLAGFGGVLLVVQPEAGRFDPYVAACFAATCTVAVRDIATRRVRDAVPSVVITLSTALGVTLLALVLSVFEGWRPVGARDFAMLAAAAIFLAGAYVMIVYSTRRGDLSVVAPFRYSQVPFAVAVGYVVWGDAPNPLAWCGLVLLVVSGVHVLRASRGSSSTARAGD